MLNKLLIKYGNQSQIASALGVSPMAVSKWFSGKNYPSRSSTQKIADDLGVSIGDVYESYKSTQEYLPVGAGKQSNENKEGG